MRNRVSFTKPRLQRTDVEIYLEEEVAFDFIHAVIPHYFTVYLCFLDRVHHLQNFAECFACL